MLATLDSADVLSPEQQARLQHLLEHERTELVGQISDLESELESLAQQEGPIEVQFDDESGEGAGVNVEADRDRSLLAQLRFQAVEVDEALARLEAGTYGFCEDCGQPIAPERLEAIPTARSCVRCKTGGLLARAGRR